jgi:hypothetical protein
VRAAAGHGAGRRRDAAGPAYLYNDVAEVDGFFRALDELLGWLVPAAAMESNR